jgi:uncharacterized protein
MSRVFVDTSAILALLSVNDTAHTRAQAAFSKLSSETARLITTSYVIVETYALLHRRLGRDAVARFRQDFAPLLEVIWIDNEVHEQALNFMLQSDQSSLSLVDAASLVVISHERIARVFAFDRHFHRPGIEVL